MLLTASLSSMSHLCECLSLFTFLTPFTFHLHFLVSASSSVSGSSGRSTCNNQQSYNHPKLSKRSIAYIDNILESKKQFWFLNYYFYYYYYNLKKQKFLFRYCDVHPHGQPNQLGALHLPKFCLRYQESSYLPSIWYCQVYLEPGDI